MNPETRAVPRLVEVRQNVLKQNDVIARALRELSAEGAVQCVGRGGDATWKRLATAKPVKKALEAD